jgi:hypothetical protein
MRTKTLLLTALLSAAPIFLFSQAAPSCEILRNTSGVSNAKLQLQCADGPAISEVQVTGDGISYCASYRVDNWRSNFPKTIPVAAGDYTVRFKTGAKWKTLHIYISKHNQENLLLN